MGSFIGHIMPGAAFLLVGLWHLFNTIKNYAQAGPWDFKTRLWFPATDRGKLKYMELYGIMFGGCLSIAGELFICPQRHQPLADDWTIPPEHLNNFEHANISLFFLLYATTALCVDIFQIVIPPGLIHAIGAFAFSQELLIFHLHSADHMGLEGQYHWLLQLIIIATLSCTVLEIACPHTFLLPMVRSMSIVFQGCWLIQTGFTLWIPIFVPKNCKMNHQVGHSVVRCADHESTQRAKAVATLQFNWYLAGLIVFTLISYVVGTHYYTSVKNYHPLNEEEEEEEEEEAHSCSLKDKEFQSHIGEGSLHDGSHTFMEEGPLSITLQR